MTPTIRPQSPQVHDLLNEIQNSAWLSYRQRDDLLVLIQQGKTQIAHDLLAAWEPIGIVTNEAS